MSKGYGNPKYVEELEAYYDAVNVEVEASRKKAKLSPQDRVITVWTTDPAAIGCCPPRPVPAPTGPISLSVASGSALLSWSYADTSQEGFYVQKSVDTGSNYVTIANLPDPFIRAYTDTLVYENNGYWYRVNAYNATSVSNYSNTASIFFPADAPSGPISLSVASGSAILSWSFVYDFQDGFNIERTQDGGMTWAPYDILADPNVRSYTDTGVSESNAYWYQINAYNTVGTSSYSNTAFINFPFSAPTGPVSLSVASGSAQLSWSYTDTNQDGFHVSKSADGVSYVFLDTLPTSSVRAYTDEAVTIGNTYWYQVSAYNASGSILSNTASITFPIPIPQGPISLSVASGSAVLSWSYVDDGQNGFNVERSANGIVYAQFYALSNSYSRSYTDTTVTLGNTYWYRINAFNEYTASEYSNTASIDFPTPPAPSGPISLSVASGSAVLSWSYVDDNQDGFNIEYSLDGNSYFPMIQLSQSFIRHYVDQDVWEGQTFWYQINAYNAYGTSSYSNTASIEFTSSTPPPPPPMAPIFLEVFSGSAILVWDSGSADADYWSIHKAEDGPSGSFTELTTSIQEITTIRDTAVNQNQTYYYKVAAVNTGGTSSFSNVASIHVKACEPIDFNPIVYAGYVTNQDISTYRNTYGVSLPFTTSAVSQSISVWGRSTDFDVYLTLVDSNGNVIQEDNDNGWVPTGDKANGNAALTYNLMSGSYTIEVSSADNVTGRYLIYISPGPRLDYTWPNSYETATCEYIPTSNCVVVGEQGANIMWYHINDNSGSVIEYVQGCQGVCYSPVQDKIYAWVYLGNGTIGWTASIETFDNTGSFLGRSEFPRPLTVAAGTSRIDVISGSAHLIDTSGTITTFLDSRFITGSSMYVYGFSSTYYITNITNATTLSLNTTRSTFNSNFQITPLPPRVPNPDFSGYLTYDPKHDRIAFYRYSYTTTHSFNIYDIATDTFVAALNAAPYTNFYDMWEGCYSWVDDCFYVGVTSSSPRPTKPLIRVSASGDFFITASNIRSVIVASYASSSNLLITRGSGNDGAKVTFNDPLTQQIVYVSDFPDSGLFEGTGKSGDPSDDCTNVYALTVDTRNSPNVSALGLLDKDTYRPQNYLVLNSDNPGGFADGWYQYSIAFNESNSRVYSAQVDYDTYTGRLYSIRLSRAPLAEYLSPYTASVVTASCIAYDSYFHITGSNATESTYWIGRANPQNVCVSQNPSIPVLMTSDNAYWLTDFENKNRNNWFFNTVTQKLIANYSQSNLQNWCGKSAVFGHDVFVTMDAVTGSQPVGYDGPVNGVNILALSPSGSVLNTFPLTYNGRDYDIYIDADRTSSVEILQIDPATGYLYIETYSPIDYTSFGPTGIRDFLIGGYPQITASTTYSFDGMGAFNEYYWGKIFMAPTSVGATTYYTYINLIPSASTGFAGDTLTTAYGGYIHFSPSPNGQLNMGISPYGGWGGSFCYFPITDRIYIGVYKEGSLAPMIIETDKALQVQYTYDLSEYTGSNFYTPDEITYDRYNNSLLVMDGYRGTVLVIDPVAHTVVCLTDAAGAAPSGYLGSQNTAVGRDGKIYIAQQRDGDVNGTTGSIKIYQA